MNVFVVDTYEEGAKICADMFEEIIRNKPDACIGLATGSSPLGLYKELARRCKEEGLDFSKVCSVNLDEYVGLEGTHEQSYRFFMDDNLFNHINIDKANTFVVKGTGDPEANLKEFNDILDKTDRDIQLLGVGPDGHLAFNEPHQQMWDEAHIEELDDSTIEANKRFFASKEDVPTRAFTMGMGGIMRAKKLLMIISGNKEDAARKLLIDGKIDPMCPCTFLRMHRDANVIIEKELADKIGYKY
jgi:glucosamine-6-phosphate deaminase